MDFPNIPQDDLIDVMEMTRKIEKFIWETIKDNEKELAMSALMSATINSVLGQCNTLDEIVIYRNLFVSILDGSIKQVQVKHPEKPS